MKPAIAFVAFLACCGTLLGNQTTPSASARRPSPLLDELVQLTRSGSSDAEVLAYAQAHRRELPPEVSDRDLRYLSASGVSARVVRYMYAIDVRASEAQLGEGAGTDSREDSVPPRSYAANPYPQDEDVPYGNGDVGYVGNYPDSYASSPYVYPGYCDPYYDFGCYYPYSSFYAYPSYYVPWPFFGHGFHDHHGHDHHGHVDHHGHDGAHRPGSPGNMVARSDRREAWRERGFNASWRRPAVVGSRGSARSLPARQTVGPRPGVAGRMAGPRGGIRPSTPARGGASGFRGPQPNFGSRGSVSRPSFSGGGMRGFSGGGMRSFSGGGMRGTGGGSSAPRGRH